MGVLACWCPAASRADAPAAADTRRFDVSEYRVVGNSVLSETEIDRAVYGDLGPGRSAADIEQARHNLEQLYQDKGYQTVSTVLPPQHVGDGIVTIRVVERKVGRLRVTGSRYFVLNPIRREASSVRAGTVPNIDALQRQIVALNQWPDRIVTPVLRAGRAPDTVDVDLQVQDKLPLHASVELNNRQSIDTTPLRVAASATYDNLWQRGDSATVDFIVAPERPNDATVVSGSYLFRVPDSELSLLGSYLHSNSDVATIGSTTVIGRGDIAGIRLLIPLGAPPGFVQSLSVGGDYKRFIETVAIRDEQSGAPVTYWPASVAYQAAWTQPNAVTSLASSLLWTFAGLGSRTDEFETRRAFARPGFLIARADLERTQQLPFGVQAYAHASAMVSSNPVIDNEQFTLGGLDSVRGYLESEVLGDEGASIQTELRSPPLLAVTSRHVLDNLRLLAFFDVGGAAIHQPIAFPVPQTQAYTLASTGGGVRIQVVNHINAEILGAIALDRGLQTKAGEARGLFRVFGDF